MSLFTGLRGGVMGAGTYIGRQPAFAGAGSMTIPQITLRGYRPLRRTAARDMLEFNKACGTWRLEGYMRTLFTTAAMTALCLSAGTATAQFVPSDESLQGLYPGAAYSPFAQRSFPSRVF